jgi:hypothetical protein
MALLSFEATVIALAETILFEQCAGAASGVTPGHSAAAAFLLKQYAQMPDFLRLPLKLLTLLFGVWSLPFAGRPFYRLPLDRRRRQLQVWKTSPHGFRRDLIRFYEILTVFGWYAERYGEDYTHAADVDAAQRHHALG